MSVDFKGESDPARLEKLLDVMLAIARQDFEVKAPVGEAGDVIDAIAVGLNMLVEELRGEVASRQELEQAHAELKRTQAQLVHAGKLAAIGQLSAGIAHEINNPIQGVQVCLSILQRTQHQILDGLVSGTLDIAQAKARISRSDAAIADAHEAIERVRGVTASLRTFARTDDDTVTPVQLDDIIRLSCRLSESTVRLKAQLELDLPTVPLVRGNRGKLGQVVTNLLVNAIQAIPDGSPQKHRIRVTLHHDGDLVSFAVEDSGPGVPESLLDKIFEPFFTTKPADLGTGLGLALVAEIVRAHNGTIAVGRSVLNGARFEVRLPTSQRGQEVHKPVEVPKMSRRPRVLFIDDEHMLLRLFESMLAEACDVVTMSSGSDALELLRRDWAFDLVVCDLHMPNVDGIEVYETTMAFAPELAARFVVATGGAASARGRTFLERTQLRILHKPFRVSELMAFLNVP